MRLFDMARTRLAKLSLTDIDSRVRYHYRTNLRFRLGMDLETRKKIHIQTIEALCRPQNYVSRLLLNLSKEGSSAGRTAVMGGALNRIMKRKRINRQKAAEILTKAGAHKIITYLHELPSMLYQIGNELDQRGVLSQRILAFPARRI